MTGNFLNDELEAIRRLAHDFAKEVIVPVAAEYDRTADFPMPEVRKAWELGLITGFIPEALGGQGLSMLGQVLIDEEISWACKGFWAAAINPTHLGLNPILDAGTPEQKKRFVAPFTEELRFAAYASTEPSGGSDVAGTQTTATRQGDHYVLNGAKLYISNASLANVLTVMTTVNKGAGYGGLTLIVVEKGTPGVIIGKKEDKMGSRCADTRELFFQDCAVPVSNRLGAEGQGLKIARRALARGRTEVAAAATGVSRAAMEHAVRFAVGRRTGGKPLAGQQAMQLKFADMVKEVVASRALVWNAARLIDAGEMAEMEAAIAKVFASDAAMRITTEAVQVHGGAGYMRDFPVEKLMRDAKVLQIGEGTNEILRFIIAGELVARTMKARP
jgi:acyl-CoA dehydrogenase